MAEGDLEDKLVEPVKVHLMKVLLARLIKLSRDSLMDAMTVHQINFVVIFLMEETIECLTID